MKKEENKDLVSIAQLSLDNIEELKTLAEIMHDYIIRIDEALIDAEDENIEASNDKLHYLISGLYKGLDNIEQLNLTIQGQLLKTK